MGVEDILSRDGPRKLLALDGGGTRGAIAIEVLASLERVLQRALGRGDDFVLAEYFDYVAGTSTGAILATAVAHGLRVDRIRAFFHDNVTQMFTPARRRDRLRHRYSGAALSAILAQEIGPETPLGTDRLRTLLLLVLHNATTDSPWLVTNNPRAMFNQPDLPDSNLRLPLWQLVRASTAAPTYFPPETIAVGGQRFVFVDGSVAGYNNPAFQLFLMATVEPYNLGWPTGEDRLLLVSVGSGGIPRANARLRPSRMHLLYSATSVPNRLITSTSAEQDFLCRVFGACRAGDPLDEEVGDLIGRGGPATPKLFTYLRYNPTLTRAGLDRLGLRHLRPADVQGLAAVDRLAEFRAIGEAVGRTVRPDHLGGFLV